ncbi:MAG: SHD1 domain-containing protein [Thermoguttaceae bacterium]|jgi:hypothetical protein|nr:SHD1 domain-containing protein [Thermoguttaceae bacterium]
MRTNIAALVVLSFVCGLAAEVHGRTWTDSQGRTTNATFVRFHDGMVVLLRGNKTLQVRFDSLSEEDQRYVREMLAEKGESHVLPRQHSLTAGQPAEDPSAPSRTWTDMLGNRMTGQLVRVEGTQVYLRVNGKVAPYPIHGFSLQDQDYIRNWRVENAGNPLARQTPAPGRMTGDEMHMELVRRQKAAGQHEPHKPVRREDEEHMHREEGRLRHEQEGRFPHVHEGRFRHEEQERLRQHQEEQRAQPTMEEPPQQHAEKWTQDYLAEREAWNRFQADQNAPIPQLVVSNCDKECGNCKRSLPEYAQAGERCPWCKTVWQVELDERGRVVKRGPTDWTSPYEIGRLLGAIALTISILWGVLRLAGIISGGS